VAAATVTVAQQVAGVTVEPATATLGALGETVTLTAAATDANGYPVATTFAWASSDETVATVADGVVTTQGDGSATITATSGDVSGSAQVLVALPVVPDTVYAVLLIENAINLGKQGVIPVTILATSLAAGEPVEFDPTTIDAATVRLSGAPALDTTHSDVDGDGDLDVQLRFAAQGLTELDASSTVAILTGLTNDGTPFRGEVPIKISGVPAAAAKQD